MPRCHPITKGPCLPRLPVPGYEVMLPQNATAEIYQEVLKEMKLNEVRRVMVHLCHTVDRRNPAN